LLEVSGGSIVRTIFDQCWFSSHTQEGVLLTGSTGSIRGLEFNNCHFFDNDVDGVKVNTTNATNITINGGAFAANTNAGVSIAANVTDFCVQNARIGNTHDLAANGSGIVIANGTSNNFRVINNDLRGNTTAAFTNGATGANQQTFGNLGHDGQLQAGFVDFKNAISPANITANQNDYNPTGLSSASALCLTSDASRNITGLAGGVQGRYLMLYNTGSNNIVLKNADSGSTAANRFEIDGDFTLYPKGGVTIWYDSTSSRWRVAGQQITERNAFLAHTISTANSFTANQTNTGAWTSTADIGTAWHVGGEGAQITLANGGTKDLATGSGLITVINGTDGTCALYLCAAGAPIKIGGSAAFVVSATPASGEIGLYYTGTAYRLVNNMTGGSRGFFIGGFKVRNAN
jgi:hypothetical protein